MNESDKHIKLVQTIIKYLKNNISTELHPLIKADCLGYNRPTNELKDFIPDVYFWHQNQLIIGEAKTANDLTKSHSKEQYVGYIKNCENFWGASMIIICVPWQSVPEAKNYFVDLKKELKSNIKIVIINELMDALIV